jgi:hypothetical protein
MDGDTEMNAKFVRKSFFLQNLKTNDIRHTRYM